MRILIGYDGSECSDAALDDLKMAGLPDDIEAHVMSVAEVWLPPPPSGVSISDYAIELQSRRQPFQAWETHAKEITAAGRTAERAACRLRANFPAWDVSAASGVGSPAWEILSRSGEMASDLIVVGSHGRSALGRFFLGSISQKVLAEARCTVRIARGKVDVDPAPARLVVGFDGSPGAKAAVAAVASRNWPEHTQVRVVAVADVSVPVDIGLMAPVAMTDNRDWLLGLSDGSIETLRSAGLETEFVSEFGNPKNVLVDIAENWHADSIFVGANRIGSRVERVLLGSIAAAVAARAHCSVEVVRTGDPPA
jgi:nucleotide-binding universal stress UspA family protein